MNHAESQILYIFFDILVPLTVGYILKQKQVLTSNQCNGLIRFNIRCIITILTLLSFWILPLRPELLALPTFAFTNVLVPLAIVLALGLQKRFTSLADRGSYLITVLPSNLGSLGGLCSYLLYGEIAFAYVQIVGVFQNLVMFFILFPMGYYYQQRITHPGQAVNFFRLDWKKVFFNWNQLSVLGIAAGIALYAAGVPRPPILGTVFQYLVHVSAWAALLPIGYLIDFSSLRKYYKVTLDLIPIKLLLTPAILYVVSTWFFTDPVILGTLIIMMGSPCAINALITTRLYDLNVNLSMAPFISTTLIYILLCYPVFYLLVSAGYLPFK